LISWINHHTCNCISVRTQWSYTRITVYTVDTDCTATPTYEKPTEQTKMIHITSLLNNKYRNIILRAASMKQGPAQNALQKGWTDLTMQKICNYCLTLWY